MSALVERIIAARDRLRELTPFTDSDDHFAAVSAARDAMADAANALDQRDEEAHYLRARAEKLTEALTFYATAEAHEVDSDRGDVARKALKMGDL